MRAGACSRVRVAEEAMNQCAPKPEARTGARLARNLAGWHVRVAVGFGTHVPNPNGCEVGTCVRSVRGWEAESLGDG
jgi:hypothetical protein